VSSLPHSGDPSSGPGGGDLAQAAWNAVAVASLAYQQEIVALSTVLALAAGHGLTTDDLRHASGLDAAFIQRLLAEHEGDAGMQE
jgi:hypothetical protein